MFFGLFLLLQTEQVTVFTGCDGADGNKKNI